MAALRASTSLIDTSIIVDQILNHFGAASIPQILLVVFDLVLDQELEIFVLEGSFGMMLTLNAP